MSFSLASADASDLYATHSSSRGPVTFSVCSSAFAFDLEPGFGLPLDLVAALVEGVVGIRLSDGAACRRGKAYSSAHGCSAEWWRGWRVPGAPAQPVYRHRPPAGEWRTNGAACGGSPCARPAPGRRSVRPWPGRHGASSASS